MSSSDRPRGLGELNWLPDRSQAEASLYKPSESSTGDIPSESTADPQEKTTADQHQEPDRKVASKISSHSSSKSASIRRSNAASKKGGQQKVTPTLEEVPPPPTRQREVRVQFNHRILPDRHAALDNYKTSYGATWQSVVDQMVDEYLARRGLLPNAGDQE